jgi:hypothetical protein
MRARTVLALGAALGLGLLLGHQTDAVTAAPPAPAPALDLPTAQEILADSAARPAAAKLTPALRAAASTDAPETRLIVVSSSRLDLGAYGRVLHRWTWPAGEHLTLLKATPKQALAIAALSEVATVESGEPVPGTGPAADPELALSYAPLSAAEDRERLDKAPTWAATARRLADAAEQARQSAAAAKGAGFRPDGWHDVGHGHSSREAWDLGYKGDGVRVAVVDTSVDFPHHDLQGIFATLPEGMPGAGWPYIYDPFSVYSYVLDVAALKEDPDADQNTRLAYSGLIQMYQESDVVPQEVNGEMTDTACFEPLSAAVANGAIGPRNFLPEDCMYVVPKSASGKVKLGYHPDTFLFQWGAKADIPGEFAGVLLVDPTTAGVYDTVYVDLDQDHNFAEEKPVTKASPLAWRDIDGDGVSDLSGGTLYFLADGERPVPGGYLWEDPENMLPVPPAYSMVAFHYDLGQHGTLCTSNIASQGRLHVPAGTSARYPRDEGNPALNGNHEPDPIMWGNAPDTEIVAVGNFYSAPSAIGESSWRFAVLGADPEAQVDDIQISSNSYGTNGQPADAWNNASRFIDHYVRTFNPHHTYIKSMGNSGPGYGSSSPPMPMTGIGVAAATQFSSTGWDSMGSTDQITYGDLIAFSSPGPWALGNSGTVVAANGAYAGGLSPINMYTTNRNLAEGRRNGTAAISSWGGTSRSGPVAAAILALGYQAFHQRTGQWPTWEQAHSLLAAGARFSGYDAFSVGAGVVDGGNTARIAAGKGGLYAMPAVWAAGDFRGETHHSYARLARPGGVYSTTVTLENPSAAPIAAQLSGQTLRRTSSYEFTFETKDRTLESTYTSLQAPDYLVPLDKSKVPEGTDLMAVRVRFPYSQLDADGNTSVDNVWRTLIYRHSDWNDDQKLWNDANGDGIVQHMDVTPRQDVSLDFLPAVDYSQSEIQQDEYARFVYTNQNTNNFNLYVHHPRERWGDGVYLGLVHQVRPASVPTTTFEVRVDFYRYQEWPWLTVADGEVTVPAGGTATFNATLSPPADAPPGLYQGSLIVRHDRPAGDMPIPTGGGHEPADYRLSIPVTAAVAPPYDWTGNLVMGGTAGHDPDAPYTNGAVRGTYVGGTDSGDWRFYFADAAKPAPGTFMVLKTTWDDPNERQADIDSRLYGPAPDRFTNPGDPSNEEDDWSDPAWYGPSNVQLLAQSRQLVVAATGRAVFNTTSGENEDWLSAMAPANGGLLEVMLRNVLFSGAEADLPFESTLGSIRINPYPVAIYGDGCSNVTISSTMAMSGFSTQTAGLAEPTTPSEEEIQQDNPDDPTTASFKKELDIPSVIAVFRVRVEPKASDDTDLFVLRDANDDGTYDPSTELVASSTNPAGIVDSVSLTNQPAGKYAIWVLGWEVPTSPSTFVYSDDIIYGDNLSVQGAPAELQPGQAYTLEVCVDPSTVQGKDGPLRGVLVLQPEGAPGLVTVDVTWLRERPVFNIYLPWLSMNYDFQPPEDVPTAGVVDRPVAGTLPGLRRAQQVGPVQR